LKYRYVLDDLERVTGSVVDEVRIVGGGANNKLLNQFAANATGRKVVAGPVEATAIGNMVMQLVAVGAASSLSEVRSIVDRSFPVEVYQPTGTADWESAYQKFRQYCS
jgi:rhamnulokinase